MNKVDALRHRVAAHMEDIQSAFVPGAKITVFVRIPDVPDHSQDFMMTDDDANKLTDEIAGFFRSKYDERQADPD